MDDNDETRPPPSEPLRNPPRAPRPGEVASGCLKALGITILVFVLVIFVVVGLIFATCALNPPFGHGPHHG
jgi:hypothetical protein